MEGKWGGQQSKKLGYNECRQIYIVTLNSLFYLWKLYLYHQVILIDPSEKRKKEEEVNFDPFYKQRSKDIYSKV